jgi:hypothetical protein
MRSIKYYSGKTIKLIIVNLLFLILTRFIPATTLIDSCVASSSPDTFYTDTGLKNGQIYYYRITAIDNTGNESGFSEEDSATPVTQSPQIISVNPLQNALNISANTNISVTFNQDINFTTINANTFIIHASQTGLHAGTYSYDSGTKTATFDPTGSFQVGEVVTVILTTDIQDTGGTALSNPYEWSFTIGVSGGSGKFTAKTGYTAGNGHHSVFSSDLDGDGDMDLMTTNYWTQNVSVLLNNGDGTFSEKTGYTAGTNPRSVFSSDLDGDGNLDLAVANSSSNNVSVLLNNGDGTFSEKTDYTAGDYPTSVFSSDLDGDGDMDLMTTNYWTQNVSVLLNNRDGTFSEKTDYTAGDYPTSVFSSDLDGNGNLDLAVANSSSNNVSVLLNNGDGTFSAKTDYTVGTTPRSVFSSDLDGDGDMDLAVANCYSDNVSVFLNNGDGTFSAKTDYTAGDYPTSVFSSDLDGDGDMDLAVANYCSDNVSVLLNNGDGTFSEKTDYTAGDYPTSVFSSDLDGDGDMDLAVANENSGNVSILLNRNREADISLSSNSLNFGGVKIDSTKSLQFTIYNNGADSTLSISDIASSNPAFVPSPASGTILPDESLIVTVAFTPTAHGNYQDRLAISCNDPHNPMVYVDLSGFCGSYISGVVTTDTTWSKTNSPYIVDGNLAVDTDVTLTLEAGVELRFDGYYNFNIYGNLIINGTSNDTVIVSSVAPPAPGLWTKLNFMEGSSADINFLKLQGSGDGLYASNVASFNISNSLIEKNSNYGIYLSYTNANIDNCKIKTSGTGIYAVSCSPQINNCAISDNSSNGLYFTSGTSSPTITNSTISNNNGYGINYNYGYGQIKVKNCQIVANTNWGLYFSGAYSGTEIKNCNIAGNSAGIYSNIYTSIENNTISANNGDGIYTASSGVTIYQNRISGNAEDGIKTLDNIPISYNDIFNNGSDGIETSSLPTINYNNIYSNTDYNIRATGEPTGTINAENNYWGSADMNVIKAGIWDFYDAGGSVTKVDYDPYFTERVGMLPVSDFTAQTLSGGQVKLSWNVCPFANQYLLYYDNQTGTIDTATCWVTLDSTYTEHIATLPDGEYQFGINAKSSDRRKSSLSVCSGKSDGTPLVLLAAEGVAGDSTITVIFDEETDSFSACNISNWSLSEGFNISKISKYGDTWTTKASMYTVRRGLAAGVINNKLYAVGGRVDAEYLSTVEEYDPLTDTWTTKASMPTARDELAVGVINDKIYAIGGYSDAGNISTMEEYDPVSNTWTTKASMPTARDGLAVGVINDKIYAIGGYSDAGNISTVEEYDPVSNTWKTKASMPTARDGLAVGVINDKIYAIGGYSGAGNISTVEEYDPVSNTWKTRASMPTARSFLTVSVIKNEIYAVGGPDHTWQNTSTVEKYDPTMDTWTAKTSMPTARGYLGAGVINNKIYAVGGTDVSWQILSTVEEYIPNMEMVILHLANGQVLPHSGTQITVTCNNIKDIYDNKSGEQFCTFYTDDGNNNPSIVLSIISGEQSSNVRIDYVISDTEGDSVSLVPEYTMDGEASWRCATVSGDTSGITQANYTGYLVWKSEFDLSGKDIPNVKFKVTPKDADPHNLGTHGITNAFHLDNNKAPSVVISDLPGEQHDDIVINYQLSDAENDTLSIWCEYYDETLKNWACATITGDTSGITQYTNSVIWHSRIDLPEAAQYTLFRITPSDNDIGLMDTTKILLNNLGVPSVAITTVIEGELSGDVRFDYILSDDEGDTLTIYTEYSTSSGLNWNIATVTGDTTNIDTTRYRGNFVWHSGTDLPGVDLYTVRFRITPTNVNTGIPGETSDFHLDNNDMPEISLKEIPDVNTGDIPVSYTLNDTEGDTLNIFAEYFDKAAQIFKPATVSGTMANLDSSQYSGDIVWRSLEDFANIADTAQFRMNATDNDTGLAHTIALFIDNSLPAIALDDISGEQAEDVLISYEIANDSLTTVSLHCEYSVDGSNNWNIAAVNGDTSEIDFNNYIDSLIWNSMIDLNGLDLARVTFKITPYDISIGFADSTNAFHLDNNNIPVIDTLFTPTAEETGDFELRFIVADAENDTLNYCMQYSMDSGNHWEEPSISFDYYNIPAPKDTLSLVWHSDNDISNLDLNTVMFKVIPMDNDTGIFGQTGVFHVDNETGPLIVSRHPEIFGLWQDTIIIHFDRTIDTNSIVNNYEITSTKSGLITVNRSFSENHHSLFLFPTQPFAVNDIVTVNLYGTIQDASGNGLDGDADGDPEGSPTDDYSWIFTIPYLGDYNADEQVEIQDLIIFAEAWQNDPQDLSREIGPVVGDLPEFQLAPDNIIDFEDFVTLARMWNWSAGLGKIPALFNNNLGKVVSQPANTKSGKSDKYSDVSDLKAPMLTLNPLISDDPWRNSSGGGFNIEVKVNSADILKGSELILKYDPELLSFDGFYDDSKTSLSKANADLLGKISGAAEEMQSSLAINSEKLVLKYTKDGTVLLNIVQLAKNESIADDNSNILTLQFNVEKTGISDIEYFYSIYSDSARLVEQNRSQVQIDSKLLVPEAFAIYQNYPNPFNLATTIKYQVPIAAKVNICIYDLQGRLVNNLVDSQHNPGYYSVIWSGKNRKGQTLSSGMYFYQFRAKSENNSYLKTKKMLILK